VIRLTSKNKRKLADESGYLRVSYAPSDYVLLARL